MKTVVSKTGIEVLYPCTVHLLQDNEIVECDYTSDQTGRDLLTFICDYLSIHEREYWGLRFVNSFGQRHWLDLNKLIKPQVKNDSPITFHFRAKVYVPDPYKLEDDSTKFQIFMQLRYDLSSGRLCCGPSDAALMLALVLQYIHGNFDPTVHFGNYIKDKIIYNQSFSSEMKAIDLHKNHLQGLSKAQTQDLFLRMACQLDTYGVDPYLVEYAHQQLNLWINHQGMCTYLEGKKVHHLDWMAINRIKQDNSDLLVYLCDGEVVRFSCLTKGECQYIFLGAIDHLAIFTTSCSKSTIGTIGNESEDEREQDIQSMDMNERNEDYSPESVIEPGLKHLLEKSKCKGCFVRTSLWPLNMNHFYQITLAAIIVAAVIEVYFLFATDMFGYIVLKRHIGSLIRKHVTNKLFK